MRHSPKCPLLEYFQLLFEQCRAFFHCWVVTRQPGWSITLINRSFDHFLDQFNKAIDFWNALFLLHQLSLHKEIHFSSTIHINFKDCRCKYAWPCVTEAEAGSQLWLLKTWRSEAKWGFSFSQEWYDRKRKT